MIAGPVEPVPPHLTVAKDAGNGMLYPSMPSKPPASEDPPRSRIITASAYASASLARARTH
jgi:hypothetical protein